MSDQEGKDNSGIIPIGRRDLAKRSENLVQRGLDSLLAQRERILRFPDDRSVGRIFLESVPRDPEKVIKCDARGSIRVPYGYEAHLEISGVTDLSFLTEFQPDDLFRVDCWHIGERYATKGMAHIGTLKGLKELNLAGSQIMDFDLVNLRGMKDLKQLNLYQCYLITDAGLVHLKEMKAMEGLYLWNIQITDAGLVHLKEMKSLKSLILGGNQVTDAGKRYLKSFLPPCV